LGAYVKRPKTRRSSRQASPSAAAAAVPTVTEVDRQFAVDRAAGNLGLIGRGGGGCRPLRRLQRPLGVIQSALRSFQPAMRGCPRALRGFQGGGRVGDRRAPLGHLRPQTGVLAFQFSQSRVHANAKLDTNFPLAPRSIPPRAVNKYSSVRER
jgi:hypothetical protein